MKTGAENRTKTVTLGVLIALAACGLLYNLFSLFSGNTPPPSVAPVASVRSNAASRPGGAGPADTASRTSTAGFSTAAAPIPGVAAQRIASAPSSLDPRLDQAAMLRTEGLVYSGSGRNIFSAVFTPVAAPVLPRNVPPARPTAPPAYTPPVQVGPPPPPPIPLKFFGTAQRAHATKQAFLLSGEDVYLASPGDIVAKRYKVVQILPFAVQVTDLGNNNTQTLPLQQN